jgi:hypothetical protein
MKKRRKATESVKAILVRDHNWRMGNLRRIWHSLWGLNEENRHQIQRVLEYERAQQERDHQLRLEAISDEQIDTAWAHEMMTEDTILADAIWRAEYNKRENALLRMHKLDEEIMKGMSEEDKDAYMYGDKT